MKNLLWVFVVVMLVSLFASESNATVFVGRRRAFVRRPAVVVGPRFNRGFNRRFNRGVFVDPRFGVGFGAFGGGVYGGNGVFIDPRFGGGCNNGLGY